jgi:hypothetical protein
MTDDPTDEGDDDRPNSPPSERGDRTDRGYTPFDEIQSGDHGWYAEWGMNHLRNDPEKREETYQSFLVALRDTCQEYTSGLSDGFPIAVAEWIGKEADAALNDDPSHLLKRPVEASRTPMEHHENSFEELERLWEEGGNFAHVVKALSYANDEGVMPPAWVWGPVFQAAARILNDRSRGEATGFDKATGFSSKRDLKKATTQRDRAVHVALMAEAIDAGLNHKDARELALFEVELVFDLVPFEEDTLQKYYETTTTTREGFGEAFLISLPSFSDDLKVLRQSILMSSWRRKVLPARLNAYRKAMADGLDGEGMLAFVTERTVKALQESQPPQGGSGRFIE